MVDSLYSVQWSDSTGEIYRGTPLEKRVAQACIDRLKDLWPDFELYLVPARRPKRDEEAA